jgi:hypothetical protein
MKNKLSNLWYIPVLVVLTACGSGGGSTDNGKTGEETQTIPEPTDSVKKPVKSLAVQSAQELNVSKLIKDIDNTSVTNYDKTAKTIVTSIRIDTTPNLENMFDVKSSPKTKKQSTGQKTQKMHIERSDKRTKREYTCPNGGTFTINLDLIDRGFGVDTHKRGDVSSYNYEKCKTVETTIDGSISLTVNDFTEFDFSKVGEADPLGKFTTDYDFLTISDNDSKLLLDGSLIYESEASYPTLDGKPPHSLYKLHRTFGFKINVEDKQSATQSTMEWKGLLEKIDYRHVFNTPNDFTFCKTMDYSIEFGDENGITSTMTVKTIRAICGKVIDTSTGIALLEESGEVEITIDEAILRIIYLGNDRFRYEYDENGDGTPEDSSEDIQYTYTNKDGFTVVENPYINDSGMIDFSRYLFPTKSVNKKYKTVSKSFFSDTESIYPEGDKVTVSGNKITIKNNFDTDEREEYVINDKNISIINYVENSAEQVEKERTVTIGRLYDVGSVVYDYQVSGSSVQTFGNTVYISKVELTASCKIEKKLNQYKHTNVEAISLSGDMILMKCTVEGTWNIENKLTKEKQAIPMNDTTYYYLKKDVGLVAEIDDNCIPEGTFFSNEVDGCSINDYEYKFFEKYVNLP